MTINLTDLRSMILAGARANFEKHGRVAPVVVMAKSDRVAVVPTPLGDEDDKDVLARILHELVTSGLIDGVALINEAWAYPIRSPELRSECVIVNLQTADTTEVWTAFIHRDGQAPTLDDFEKWPEHVTGRFTGFFSEVH